MIKVSKISIGEWTYENQNIEQNGCEVDIVWLDMTSDLQDRQLSFQFSLVLIREIFKVLMHESGLHNYPEDEVSKITEFEDDQNRQI